MPTVSVVVPNYNHARFLDERLRSIFNQSYQDFEVIFLDDASSDNSIEVFRRYSTRNNVRAILNDRNSGSPFRQWNQGIRAAKGSYIWIAESDDVAEPQLLETLVRLLEKHPRVGVACCNSTIIDEHGAKQYKVDRWSAGVDANRWSRDYINTGVEECRRYLLCRNTIPNASAVVFRKAIFEQCGYANETMTRCGDWWVWAQMLLLSDIAYVAAPLNLFRRHMAVSHAVSNHNIAIEETLRILHMIASRLDFTPEDEAEMCRAFVAHLDWRHSISHPEAVVIPATILYLAAITSEWLCSVILDFVSGHDNWKIDWSPPPSCALANIDPHGRGCYVTIQNLAALGARLHQQLSVLKSEREQLVGSIARLHQQSAVLTREREQLLASRSYRFAQKLQQVRSRLAPNHSVQYNWLRRLKGLIQRVRTGRTAPPPRIRLSNQMDEKWSAAA